MTSPAKVACAIAAAAFACASGCGDVRREPITGPKASGAAGLLDAGGDGAHPPGGDGGISRARCASNDDCAPSAPKCAIVSGECGPCTLDADCGPNAPRYDVGSGACVECLDPSDCPKNACPGATTCPRTEAVLCHPTQHRCVECVTDGHCSSVGERCSSALGVCATPCTTSAVCPHDEHICDDVVGFCVECIDDADCPSSNALCRRSACTQ